MITPIHCIITGISNQSARSLPLKPLRSAVFNGIKPMSIVAWTHSDTILRALMDTESFSSGTDISCCLSRASKHGQSSWYSFSYLLSKPLPLTAVLTTALCLFQKHNIAIICQLIPAWTPRIVNSLQHKHTRAHKHSHSFSLRCIGTQCRTSRLTSALILLSLLCVPDNHYLDLPDRGDAITILSSTLLFSILCFGSVIIFNFLFHAVLCRQI